MQGENKNELEPETVLTKVTITEDDVKHVTDFYTHYNIPVDQELKDALEAFVKNPNIDNQSKIRRALCNSICTSKAEAFNCEMFQKIKEETKKVGDELNFDAAITETLNQD